MTVCLHCGELASDGALFCTKCGYTLPQVDRTTGAVVPPPNGAPPAPGMPAVPPFPAGAAPLRAPPPAPLSGPWAYPPVAYATLASPPAGSVGPIPPPPGGKYCVRCRTIISRVAVYCPVCQQPQS